MCNGIRSRRRAARMGRRGILAVSFADLQTSGGRLCVEGIEATAIEMARTRQGYQPLDAPLMSEIALPIKGYGYAETTV